MRNRNLGLLISLLVFKPLIMTPIFVLLFNHPVEKVIRSLSESRKTIFFLVSIIVQVKINASFSQNFLKTWSLISP